MAFAAPALFLFVFGIAEAGHALWLQNMLSYAVAEAARCATVNQTTCGTAAQIQSYAASQSSNIFDSSVFSVTTPSCGNRISASYTMTLNIVNLSLPVSLTADACYPK
jgi:Flp pilus assembly protein TadG